MRLRLKVCAVAALATPWLAIPSLAAATPVTPAAPAPAVAQAPPATGGAAAACGPAAPGFARCFALIRTDVHAGLGVRGPAARAAGHTGAAAALPPGYGPADLQAAYNLPASAGSGQTIGIVDAFDDPAAEADLAVYRQTFGLPACTTANGCFSKVNQSGVQGNYPATDPSGGWEAEESLDLDMVSAACPQCHILLVEGNSPAVTDLAASVDTAAALGANVVSNSYGTSEGQGMQAFFPDYQHAGHVIVASSGDFGYTTAQFPAVTPGVLAVGGTSLSRAHNTRGWTETAWGHGSSSGFLGGSGSGCSAYVDKPAWQHDKYCHMRTITDVSADADPQTGVAVYDTTPSQFGPPGWLVIGGTSASAPFISGAIGQAGNSATFTAADAYAHAASFFDVTKGSNGNCGKDYLCTAKTGYDGPTGLGTPDGLGGL
jgi:subtilase family serine protease